MATPERLALTTTRLKPPLPGTLKELRALAFGDGANIEHALYSLAFVYWKQRQSRSGTLKATGYYLGRFTSGTHYSDVLWLRINALCKTKVTKSCRQAAYTYLRKFPGDKSRAAQANAIINDQ